MRIRRITIDNFKHSPIAYKAMKSAGYLMTDVFVDDMGKTYSIDKFKDGTVIDSRNGNAFGKFHKKVYND